MKRHPWLILVEALVAGSATQSEAHDIPCGDTSITSSIETGDRFRGYSRSEGYPVAPVTLLFAALCGSDCAGGATAVVRSTKNRAAISEGGFAAWHITVPVLHSALLPPNDRDFGNRPSVIGW